jgi:hypothetical protein
MKNVNKHIQVEARYSWHPLSHGTTNLHNQPEQSTCTMDNQLAQSTCTCTRNLHKQCAALSGGRRHSCQCHPRTHRSQAWPNYRKARYNADFDVGGTMANTCPMRTGASRHAPRDPVGSFAWASSCSVLLKSTNDKHKGTHKHNAHGHGHVEHHNELLDQSMTSTGSQKQMENMSQAWPDEDIVDASVLSQASTHIETLFQPRHTSRSVTHRTSSPQLASA